MNSKERVLTALNHQQTDRVAVDFGGTPVTGIHVLAIEKIRKHYDLSSQTDLPRIQAHQAGSTACADPP